MFRQTTDVARHLLLWSSVQQAETLFTDDHGKWPTTTVAPTARWTTPAAAS